jgi:two-component system chemotaxis response regulator CheY
VSKTVLVVDDSPSVRSHLRAALTEAGYDVVEAADGAEALDRVATRPGLVAVVADVNMPRMNGLEMLEKLKANGKNPGLPILMLTTEGQPSLLERAKQAGARGWIIKPVKPEQLVAAVRAIARP